MDDDEKSRVLTQFKSVYYRNSENGLERSDHLRPTTSGPNHLRPTTSDPLRDWGPATSDPLEDWGPATSDPLGEWGPATSDPLPWETRDQPPRTPKPYTKKNKLA